MTKTNQPQSQLMLSVFESTSLSWGLSLDEQSSVPRPVQDMNMAGTGTLTRAQPPAPAARLAACTYRLDGDRQLAKGWKARAAETIDAIRLAQEIESASRPATPEEQSRLALFTGFGASELANSLFRRQGEGFRDGWADLGNTLEQLVSPADMAALARATQYAHYTPELVIRAMWHGLQRMGFAGGEVLEPGCGTGLFLALMPEAVAADSAITAVEMDPVTARIARLLYPEAWVRHEDFTKAKLGETFDLALGNPPFSDRTVRANDPAGRLGLSLHEYFIARSIERLRPGGLAAFVCSRFLMDRLDDTARRHIGSMADLVGAIRLPQGAMMAASGTGVVVDLLFFQKREPGTAVRCLPWTDLVEVTPGNAADEGPLRVNEYFGRHASMVLGEHAWNSGPFGPAYTCKSDDVKILGRLDATLAAAVNTLPASIHAPSPKSTPVRSRSPDATRMQVGTAAEGATVKEGSYVLIDDTLMQVIDGSPIPVAIKSGKASTGIFAKHARIIRMLVPVRDALRELLRAQVDNRPWGAAQVRLRVAYSAFIRAFGPHPGAIHPRPRQRTDKSEDARRVTSHAS